MNRRRALINSVCDFYVQIVILDLDFGSIKYSILSTFAVKKKGKITIAFAVDVAGHVKS